jgi:acyl-CoA synthetase (AMP-forming)/AMP-acid ligase II
VAERAPDRPAVIMAGAGDVVTYRELEERSNQLAHLFRARGLGPGASIALFLENHPRSHEIMWAAQRSGLYYTAVNTHLTAEEAGYIVDDCGATLLVSSAQMDSVTGQLTPDLVPNVRTRLMVDGGADGWESYEKAVSAQATSPIDDECEGEWMLYSSGTTGRPKGIHRKATLAPFGTNPDTLARFMEGLDFKEGDVYLSPAPLFHSAPLAWTMAVHRRGGTAVVMERFDARFALELIERHRVTHSQMVPTMFVRMLKLPEVERTRYDLSSLRAVVHAAAPCPVQVKKEMIEWWGPIISEYYSSTEGAGATFIGAEEWLGHPGSVGKPLLAPLHILDDDGHELPRGEPGVIWSEGPARFEYHNDPEKTAQSRSPEGWTSVGDVGYLDEDGYLFLTDRKTFMIISGGVNIYPQEAENVLVSHPKIFDVAVFGVPNPDLGEEVKAVVQPVDWADAGPALAEELIAFCRQRLSGYKCPRTVDFERELPRSDTGKLYKRLLRDRYWAGATPGQLS